MVYVVCIRSCELCKDNHSDPVYLSQLTSAKRNSHAIRSDDRAINRLIRLSIETGSITAAFAIIELGFFLGPATKTTNIHLFLCACSHTFCLCTEDF